MDAARGQERTQERAQEILDRWCVLAEQRLDHLTELFETGRWRRYHSELSFLENIQEAKSAVETWHRLATREATLDNSAVDISWLNSSKPVPPRRNPLAGYHIPPPPRRRVEPMIEAPIVPETGEGILAAGVPQQGALQYVPEQTGPAESGSEQAAVALANAEVDAVEATAPILPVDNGWQQALDLSAMQARYPLLRNAL
jgi:uncharacterized repeat protein (TIGR03809 family)